MTEPVNRAPHADRALPEVAAAFDLPRFDGEPRCYIFCGPPRSGSNMICDLLTRTGQMGVPQEYLHPDAMMRPLAERLRGEGETIAGVADYIAAILARRTSANGVFGLKAFFWQVRPLVSSGQFPDCFPNPRYIYLTREDAEAQTVSLAIALKTNRWTAADPPEDESAFDPAMIELARRILRQDAEGWHDFFEGRSIDPLRITYEQVLADPEPVCQEICRRMGVEPATAFSIESSRLRRQHGPLYREWLARMRAMPD